MMRFNGSMTSGASWTVFRFLRQYHVTERDFPSGYIYGAQRYGYVETTLVWYTSVYIYVLGYISVYDNDPFSPTVCLPSTVSLFFARDLHYDEMPFSLISAPPLLSTWAEVASNFAGNNCYVDITFIITNEPAKLTDPHFSLNKSK